MNLEARARLQLSLAPGVGPATAWRWIWIFGGAAQVLRQGADALMACGARADAAQAVFAPETRELLERELQSAEKLNIQFLFPRGSPQAEEACITPPEPSMPRNELEELSLPPLVLRVRGRTELLDSARTRIAMVGARTPTPYGLAQAARFSRDFCAARVVVVSGFARGIDRAAHEAALKAGGDTIAVVGSGLAELYPSDRADLTELLTSRGLFVSEFPIHAHATKAHFPRRNRTLAALGRACVVVEAGLVSGSLITAHFTEELERQVYAVPGRADSPMSAGCHQMIQNDTAKLCTSPSEVLADLGIREVAFPVETVAPGSAPDYAPAMLRTACDGATMEELAVAFTGDPERLFENVLSLEMSGLLERMPGGIYKTTESGVRLLS